MSTARALTTVVCLLAWSLIWVVSSAGAWAESFDRSPLALQVALDRVRFSPGPIDGYLGTNTVKALKAYQRANGLDETGQPDDAVWSKLGEAALRPALVEYIITEWDVAGPFEPVIPESLEEKAKLGRLSYTGPHELLAEKFHMDIDLLQRLNRGRNLDRAGTRIIVANVGRPVSVQAARLEADKSTGAVLVFDSADVNIAFFPATIGSEETPSPTGNLTITRIARNPTYTYDPTKLNFKGVKAKEVFEIQPGPNNPVGLVWIALSKPSYGIHGSPQPSGISRQRSHGCVRLTNWDALDLADMVKAGIPVEFYEHATVPEMAAIAADDVPKEPVEEESAEAPFPEQEDEQVALEPGINDEDQQAALEPGINDEHQQAALEPGINDEDQQALPEPSIDDEQTSSEPTIDGSGETPHKLQQRITRYIAREHLQDRGRFAEWVDYFDQGMVSRDTIRRDRRRFNQRWPVRRYELIPGSVEISSSGENRYVVTFSYEYETANPALSKIGRGQGSSSVALHDLGRSFEVQGIREVVYRLQ